MSYAMCIVHLELIHLATNSFGTWISQGVNSLNIKIIVTLYYTQKNVETSLIS
jgi:hypothetical protein